ncbi:tRNA pseudouridine(38-40) synthase TruA [Anaplasma marginale]|uniref:tRNA pseudouridine synthase A n=1 Tax=Anaplasma marginale TaxID=770 RepID=A0A643CLW6_ANAMA|nr:tRNA pseudouridine(38-40) synthase TruA [Anaplasma marginale]KAA8474430.1 tRNA pseudouridine(38-40) synthase TruA [Anaplasma marginale]KAB0452109.1 tRNA pseudouridine(38-40) synthase TruA [Anaplasma marginale]
MRYRAVVEYDGTAFIGWQRQKGVAGRSVQESIEDAIYRLSQQHVTVFAAGRTDAGVHALGQVVHFDLNTSLQDYVVKNALNHYLRSDMVSILSLEEAAEGFHARFSAKKRHYMYKIVNRDAPPCLDRLRMWHVPKQLDVPDMQEAANYMVGEKKDFASFRAKECQSKSSVRTVDRIDCVREGNNIFVHVSAKSFLHKQVRIIVGTLVQCGHGAFPPSYVLEILERKNRAAAGITAPPHGLYLVLVEY